jgi:UDPglucose 6-dehydrogenase
MQSFKIGIAGYGVIGQAVCELFSSIDGSICAYDPNYGRAFISGRGHKKPPFELWNNAENASAKMNACDVVFVCVPTPHRKYHGLDMGLVEDVVSKFQPKIFVICSALQPGTADRLAYKYKRKIVVQPEYFGETTKHPLTNLSQQNFLILGGETEDVNEVIKLYQQVYNANIRIRKVTALEAEVIKLSENRAIAYKVAQCQELYDACQAAGVDYETVRQAVYGDDPRFNLWWTWVYEEARGFNSKCIPKDVYGWYAWAESFGAQPTLTRDLLEYNDGLISHDSDVAE